MNFIYQTAKKTIAIFGFTLFVNTLTVILIFNISFRRDDPYLIGFFPAIFLVPGWIFYFIFEQYPKPIINKYSAFLCYSIIPLLYFSIAVMEGGEGSGYAFIFGIYFLAATLLSLPVLKQLDKQYIICVFVLSGLLYLLGLSSSLIR
ncbi:hypothetical protein [Gimesia maris]|jgi:hypothetical protein|uniref:hypothetical protein n=1 Tax=Gimesia maris TaxID=122 RepID=UPI000E7D585E|nr:hypothetical protein [Gimesia maris]QDU15878.1 hypothetical protein CA11_37060 [Gimesia maris]HAW30479.1 hypothetical protein [Planctomycetaceae bacterium]|tara:strand:- start:22747 stop:23187 length:441 start_codon:yes stop_codon:yes gene_type:complete